MILEPKWIPTFHNFFCRKMFWAQPGASSETPVICGRRCPWQILLPPEYSLKCCSVNQELSLGLLSLGGKVAYFCCLHLNSAVSDKMFMEMLLISYLNYAFNLYLCMGHCNLVDKALAWESGDLASIPGSVIDQLYGHLLNFQCSM